MNHHMVISTVFGEAAIIYRVRPFVLVETILPCPTRATLMSVIMEKSGGKPGRHKKAAFISEIIKNYFNGKPVNPPWNLMDLSRMTPLQRKVLAATTDIPFGEVRSYGDVARIVGRPRACRFVGTTMANNPYPILIPCHRVVRSDGSPGKFGGGTELKKMMIALEAENCGLVDNANLIPHEDKYFVDRVHFSASGAKKMAENIYPVIVQSLKNSGTL